MGVRLDPSRRAEAIEAGWEAYGERVNGLRDAYEAFCKEWDVIAICDGRNVIGALYAKDGFIHVGIKAEHHGKWASRRFIREALRYGNKTTLMDSEPQFVDFVTRLGFVKEGDVYVHRR